jgi:long-chain acyl-CoA synthetase
MLVQPRLKATKLVDVKLPEETVARRFWFRVLAEPYSLAMRIAVGNSYLPITLQEISKAVATNIAYLKNHSFKKGDRAIIISENCPEWLLMDIAILSLGGITVGIDPNCSASQVNYIINDSEATHVFAKDVKQIAKIDSNYSGTTMLFDQVVLDVLGCVDCQQYPFMQIFDKRAAHSVLQKLTRETKSPVSLYRQLFAIVDKEISEIRRQLLRPAKDGLYGTTNSDLATLVYTSGSTGTPKGCMITHGNIAFACQSIERHRIDASEKHVYLSYLPLAHIFERVVGSMTCIWLGIEIAFSDIDNVADAMKKIRPTILVGVPKVWRKIKERIFREACKTKGIRRWFAERALPIERELANNQYPFMSWSFDQMPEFLEKKILDILVYLKIRRKLGGRLRFAMSGGSATAPELIELFNSFGVPILRGYGLSETCGGVAATRPQALRPKSAPAYPLTCVGEPVEGMQIAIEEEVESSLAAGSSAGEIFIRGPLVFKGYWRLPDETAKVFTPDGYFRTGDNGYLDHNEFLHIIGRKKRSFKTDNGKYVSPEKIEKAFEGSELIEHIVPVGDDKPFVGGLVFVNHEKAKQIIAVHEMDANDKTNIYSHPLVIEAIADAIALANDKLERWEKVRKFVVVPMEASIENGLISLKRQICREFVMEHFSALADSLYN